MKTRTILFCTVALTLGACSSESGPRYTPRADIAQQNYTNENHTENRMDTKSYKQYEHREQCQNYRDLPRNMIDSCANTEEELELATAEISTHTEQKQKALPIVSSYTVLFGHDRSNIRANENEALDRAMREIDKYEPTQVTVTGYTDSSGKVDYNLMLSQKREQAVSKALIARGIKNEVLEREARGEHDQAIETKDGIRNQENRRVVIGFRR